MSFEDLLMKRIQQKHSILAFKILHNLILTVRENITMTSAAVQNYHTCASTEAHPRESGRGPC